MTQLLGRVGGRPHEGVLVVGAGPAGLTVAAELLRRGVPVRLIDRVSQPSPLSKALLVWPRTLEVLRRLGGDDRITAHGLPVDAFRYYSEARQIARIGFADRTRPMVLPQPEVVSILLAALAAAGGVTWDTELTGFTDDGPRVTAELRHLDGSTETAAFTYLVGCDGAASTVRERLGLKFTGATYPNTFLLADARVEGRLQPDAVHYFCSRRGILVLIGLPGGRFRVFTSGPPGLSADNIDLTLVQRWVDERGPGGLRLHDASWTSVFAVHARHVDRYRVGRILLAGDAAHIHSPAGGQGLNTGITDAQNLAWKLAQVWRGDAPAELLDSYERERIRVAAAVVRQADLQTRAWLLRQPAQIAARDLAARAAAATGLFSLDYVPWLAGLRTTYATEGSQVGRAVAQWRNRTLAGGLLPDRLVWDAAQGYRRRLREAVTDLRYTLLVELRSEVLPAAVAALAGTIQSRYPDLVEVRYLDQSRVLSPPVVPDSTVVAGPCALAGRGQLVLIRPDQHVAVVTDYGGIDAIAHHLAQTLCPSHTTVGAS